MDDDRAVATASRRAVMRASLGGNLVGGVLTWVYFRYIDVTAAAGGPPGPREVAFFVVAFTLIAGGAGLGSLRWSRPLMKIGALREPSLALRRQALLMPFGVAGITFLGWMAAGVAWGLVWPAMNEHDLVCAVLSKRRREPARVATDAGGPVVDGVRDDRDFHRAPACVGPSTT
jgi:hypothetical protein